MTVPEHLTDAYFKKKGTSLAIRWLGLHMSTAGGTGLIPGQESKIPQAQWCAPPPQKNLCKPGTRKVRSSTGREREIQNYGAVPG